MPGEVIGVAINGALAAITAIYAFFTYKILRANQRVADEMALQRRDFLRPVISVGPEFDDYLVASLVIKNGGPSPAKNLTFSLDKDFFPFADDRDSLKSHSIFNHPIPILSAGASLRFDLAQGFNLGKEKNGKLVTPMEFTVTAQYEYLDQKFDEIFHIDLKPYMRSTRRRSMQVDELEKIRKALEKISNK